ncbi:MAG: glycosyltransferase family 9 protein [Gammaproteobacteria bacterium]|nr:glycosyltransferase family 9 protein [Gammaproteobacteria bacterium]
MSQPDTIIYQRNGIGNLLMHTPAIQALASMDASGQVDFCLDSEWHDSRMVGIEDIMSNWKLVNKIYHFPKEPIRHKYKLWFSTPHNEMSKAYEHFQRQGKIIEMRVDWRRTMLHETEYYMMLARKLGYTGLTPAKYCPVADGPILEKVDGVKCVGICNGYFHTQSWDKKAWPHFRELVKILKGRYDVKIVKIGIEKELDGIQGDIDYVGKLRFTETAKVISQLDLLITTDTSSMHAADALRVPCIAMFGSTFVFKSGPLSSTGHVLVSPVKCRPCQSTDAFVECKEYECMKQISVGDVMNMIRDRGLL